MAAIGLSRRRPSPSRRCRRHRTDEGQDIAVDVRKALRRFAGFFDLKRETINGRAPTLLGDPLNPFFALPLFRETKDGRHVVALNPYPKLARGITFDLLEMRPQRRSRERGHTPVARR